MPNVMENLHAINSFLRTLLALLVVGGIGTGGYYAYWNYTAAERASEQKEQKLQATQQELEAKEEQLATSRHELAAKAVQLAEKDHVIARQVSEISDLNVDIEKKKAEIQRLDTALRLHKMERRLARVTVVDVNTDPDTKKTFSQIDFTELNSQGDPVTEARRFRLEGDLIYVDYWVVKFEDKYVEAADLERGTSICLFKRIFGEFQTANDGFQLDEPGQRPGPRSTGTVMSNLEKKIWDDFWNIANSPDRAAELGIRTLHGDAVSIKVNKGKTYRITVRAAGGPELEVEENVPAIEPQSAVTAEPAGQSARLAWPTWVPVRKPPTGSVAAARR